ncbi:MAG: hypothetical protein ACRDVP_11045 [Acidimicrobiales bacterium]
MPPERMSEKRRDGHADAERNRMRQELDELDLAAWIVLETGATDATATVIDEGGRRHQMPMALEVIDRLLKIQERRAKLLGPDAPSS